MATIASTDQLAADDPDSLRLIPRPVVERVVFDLMDFTRTPPCECSSDDLQRFLCLRRLTLSRESTERYATVLEALADGMPRVCAIARACVSEAGVAPTVLESDERHPSHGVEPQAATSSNRAAQPHRDLANFDPADAFFESMNDDTGSHGFVREPTDSTIEGFFDSVLPPPRSADTSSAGHAEGDAADSRPSPPTPPTVQRPVTTPTDPPQLAVSSAGDHAIIVGWGGFAWGRQLVHTMHMALRMMRRRGARALILDMSQASALRLEDCDWFEAWLGNVSGPEAIAIVEPADAPPRFQLQRVLSRIEARRRRQSARLPMAVATNAAEAVRWTRAASATDASNAHRVDRPATRPLGFDLAR